MNDDDGLTAFFTWAWIAALLALILVLSGCTQSFTGICGAVPMGQNEQGIAFLRVHCEKAE